MKKPIYIFNDGELKRKDNTIYYANNGIKKFIPIERTSDIYLFGEITTTKKFIEYCSQFEILIHFFNHYGYYVGTFYPREHYNSGYMTVQQVQHYLDNELRLNLAQSFISGAIRNILQNLKYYNNRGKTLNNKIQKINEIFNQITTVDEISELMGFEGNIREIYYSAFDKILENSDFKFEHRTKRPPKNRLNSLISFGNSILYTIILSEIYKTHLDPRIGYLHTTNQRRFTLNLDISEIFKPIIIDRMIFKLISKNMITKESYSKDLNTLILKEKSKQIILQDLEKRLSTTIHYKKIGKKVSYRRLIRLELYKLEKHLIGEELYEPFVSYW